MKAVKFRQESLFCLLCVAFAWHLLLLSPAHAAPSVAFHYGQNPPVKLLQGYDWAIVEPGHLPRPPLTGKTSWFAYLSLGEISADRPYAKDVPPAWKLGRNVAWNSWIMDQTAPDWPDFVVKRMVQPLWDAGYRGFFLDTLDSWQTVAKNETERQKQVAGLARTIAAIKARYPEARLISNRGFEIMDQIHPWLSAVAFESYFQSWNAGEKRYQPVPEVDRKWLDEKLHPIRERYHLPVIAIDYVPPTEKQLANVTTQKLRDAGFIPWVTDPLLETMPPGDQELLPREILLLYDGRETPDLLASDLMFVATILNYLGYSHRLVDAAQVSSLPADTRGVSGIVSAFWNDNLPSGWQTWLKQQLDRGTPWVALHSFGFGMTSAWQQRLQLDSSGKLQDTQQIQVRQRHPLMEFESSLPALRNEFRDLTARNAEVLLDLQNKQGIHYHPVAVTPWGGFALAPFAVATRPDKSNRWIVNPVEFLSRALRLPPVPVPDVTTENGRRILISHVDGDGFVSQAERPGYPPSSEVMLKEIFQKYPGMPITVSIIEGEIGQQGLYREKAARHERIARDIFALPNVEIASHSFSHPFKWRKASAGETSGDYHLDIPGYTFDLEREIGTTARYIDDNLAPKGKKTRVFLWTGDCNPPEDAIRKVGQAGLLNMNAGETVISKTRPTLTAVGPIGMRKGSELQIFAPNQNENVYTNNWTGPFYGFQRVIETFQMTETPRRLKPIDIYYHMYSASKTASLNALQRVYDWVLTQPVTPMFASDYIERAQGFFSMTLARRPDNIYEIRDAGALRTLRLPVSSGYPDITNSRNVAGFFDHQGVRYIHLSSGDADLALAPDKPTAPYLAYANAKLTRWTSQRNGTRFSLAGSLPLRFALGQARGCRLTVAQRPLPGRFDGELTHFALPQHAASEIELTCQR